MQKPVSWLIYGIVVSVPLVFGAVHPIVLGGYVFIILIFLGGWLLLNNDLYFQNYSYWHFFPVLSDCLSVSPDSSIAAWVG